MTAPPDPSQLARRAQQIRARLPAGGLFAGQQWRISPAPFPLGKTLARELDALGRVLLQFYRAVNLLYRKSVAGQQPAWVAAWLDRGKPRELIELQRAAAFKYDVPRIIRPDILLTEEGFRITELDSVPGGIGLTAWLNLAYAESADAAAEAEILGGKRGMLDGFAGIFGSAPCVGIIVSEEAAAYRPEMEWLAAQLGDRFTVQDGRFTDFAAGDAVYRFFELFDLANVPNASRILELAAAETIRLTPPPKPVFEEKMLLALLWNRNLTIFWRRELGEKFFQRLAGRALPWLGGSGAAACRTAALPDLGLTGLAAISRRFPARPRFDSENLRFLAARLGRPRGLSGQRPFATRLGGGGGACPRGFYGVPVRIAAVSQTRAGGRAMV